MQAAAQAAAAAASGPNNLGVNPNNPALNLPDVPDGLASPQVPGQVSPPAGPGLRVAVNGQGNPVLWTGANLPVQTQTASNPGRILVTVAQEQQQALLQWQTFDIGKNTTLNFDQSAGGANAGAWIAFNFIRDPSGRPSQILGALTTTNGLVDPQGNPEVGGQIYVINANGVIFGGSSQVNAHGLVASSLPLNSNLLQSGLLNNPDQQFTFTALPVPSGSVGPTPAFDPATAGVAPAQTPFSPDGSGQTGTQYGDVTVEPGATLTAPTSSSHVGGRIALVGPNVTNGGTISTEDGQTILAAGLQVGLAAHPSSDASLRGLDVFVGPVADAHQSAGTATNGPDALIDVARAEAAIVGKAVNQLGVIESSTSVSLNGRIDLMADYNAISSQGLPNKPAFYWQSTGSVVLGPDSVTEVLPELSDPSLITGTTLALPSQVNLQGSTIELAGATGTSPGALLLAPDANVTVTAGSWQFVNGGINPATGLPLASSAEQFIYDSGQISLGSGSVIDVSGSENVSASVDENIVSVQLTGTELADSPLQRNGPLRGQTIQIDIRDTGTYDGQPWVGTPLADTTGYLSLIQRSVGELTTDGGSVTLSAGDAISLQDGSRIDVSGGWINYQGGVVQTTKVVSGGKILDISQATPNLVYDGVYTGTSTTDDVKWGLTQSTTNPMPLTTYDPGYTQGGNAGSISITAPAVSLAGTLVGNTYPGARQINPFVPYNSSTLAGVVAAGIDPRVWELGSQPEGGSLSLVFEEQYATGAPGVYQWYSPSPPDVYFMPSGSPAPEDPQALVLSPALVDPSATDYSGFVNLTIDDRVDSSQVNAAGKLLTLQPTYGSITIAADPGDPGNVTLQTAPGGSITLDAANIDIEGGIVAPGGKLNLTAHDFVTPGYNLQINGIPAYNPERGNIAVAPGVTLNAAGSVVDYLAPASPAAPGPLETQGGSIAMTGSQVSLGAGSTVDVDGGALIGGTGKVTYGAAGAISIKAGADAANGYILGGGLVFNTADEVGLAPDMVPLQGYSGAAGGALTLASSLIEVLNSTTPTPSGTLVLPPGTLAVPSGFFDAGGFATFTLQGIGRAVTASDGTTLTDPSGNPLFYPAVAVAPGTQIYLRRQELQYVPTTTGYQAAVYSPPAYQAMPASLTLLATGQSNPLLQGAAALIARGDVVVGAGALIETDPQTNPADGVTLSGQTVAVLGTIDVPAGSITIKGAADSSAFFAVSSGALPTVDLGPASALSTAGATVLTADAGGRVPGVQGYIRSGSVLPGGTITVEGNVVAEAGALLDVSGWSDANDQGGLLDLAPASSGGAGTANTGVLGQGFVPTLVESNAGSISLVGAQELFVDATLAGNAGGPSAAGGSLSITSGTFRAQAPPNPNLMVTATGATIPGPFYGQNQTAIGHAVLDASGNALAGMGYVSAGQVSAGGFDNMTLGGSVAFHGAVTLSANDSLTIGTGGIIEADGAVTLNAPYVALGQPYLPPVLPGQISGPFIFNAGPYYFSPTFGSGSLNISAGSGGNPGLVDIGNLSLQNIGSAELVVAGGDVRGYGTLDIAGTLTITAGQVYAPTEEAFTIVAHDYHAPTDPVGAAADPGTVTFIGSGTRQVPLSAGSTLNVYASIIDQGGALRAPVGSINLGWDGSGTAPIDPITNSAVPLAQQLTLESGSTTSVSGVVTLSGSGQSLPIPYGLVLNGISWIDPSGFDITSGGLPAKAINISAARVGVNAGAIVDIGGGGDLYAYEFVPGTGGTKDILTATSASFAVIPGFQPVYAPDAAFNSGSFTAGSVTNQAIGDLGYVSVGANGAGLLSPGDQVRLDLQNGQGPQDYTLLPARYALLPGAFLVTPVATGLILPSQTVAQPDGSYLVAGYRFSALDPTQPIYSEFEVASGTPVSPSSSAAQGSVVRARAQYSDYLANTFFGPAGQSTASSTVLVPDDAGQLNFSATSALALQGSVAAQPADGGLGGVVDISGSSSENIVINDTGAGSAADTLYLSSTALSDFGSGSLLIGGTRSVGTSGVLVDVTAPSLTVDNAGDPLTGSDVILVANQSLTVANGSEIEAVGALTTPAESLLVSDSLQLQPGSSTSGSLTLSRGGTAIGFLQGTPTDDKITSTVGGTITLASGTTQILAKNSPTTLQPGSSVTLSGAGTITASGTGAPIAVTLGDGVLLRVSADSSAQSTRSGVASSTAPTLDIGAGATISGASVAVDSTQITTIDPTAVLSGAVSLSSGQISLVFDSSLAGTVAPNSLVLSGTTLASLQTQATALSLLSYSSIDTYGAGQLGSPAFADLALHAAEIRGFGTGGDGQVTFAAKTITLDDTPNGTDVGPVSGSAPAGNLVLNAGTINLGANPLAIDQFADVALNASGGILFNGLGSLATAGDLAVAAPLVTGSAGAEQTITAAGKIGINSAPGGTASVTGGLGGTLTLEGASVAVGGDIALPSGNLTVHANGASFASGSVSISGTLDVGGVAKTFNDVTTYSDGGQIELVSDSGNILVGPGGYLNVEAQPASGGAGNLSISAPKGTFTVASATVGPANGGSPPAPTLNASNGQGGTFSLDALNLSDASGNATNSLGALEAALATGGFSQSQSIRVRSGDVAVDTTVKATTINISADAGSIDVTGRIDASGATGGAIDLAANGSVTLENGSVLTVRGENFNDAGQGGTVTLEAGSYTGGSTASPTGTRDASGRFAAGTPVVDIEAGSTVDLSVVNDHPLELNPGGSGASQVPAGSVSVPGDMAAYFPVGTPGSDEIAFGSSGTITSAGGASTSFSATAQRPFTTTLAPGSTVTLANMGTMTFAGGTGGSIPVSLPLEANEVMLNLQSTNVTDLSPYNSTGTLHLRAPQVADSKGNPIDVQIDPVAGTILGDAVPGYSSINIVAEGFKVFDLSAAGGVIDAGVQDAVQNNGASFAGGIVLNQDGSTTSVAGISAAIDSALAAGNSEIQSLLQVRPGAEIVNSSGNLVLASTWDFTAGAAYTGDGNFNAEGNPALSSNWNLSGMLDRFGPQLNQPGFLTLRASGNIVLGMDPNTDAPVSLSDGFAGYDGSDNNTLWQALMLPAGSQSWSMRLVSGADFSAADSRNVQSEGALGAGNGSVLLGLGVPALATNPVGNSDQAIIPQYYQTIRTGTGDIGIYSGGDLQILDNLATIYTAGTQAALIADFTPPSGEYPSQYTSGGGNVTIVAQGNIEHLGPNQSPDSSRELPVNWLYRQGWVDPTTGQFGSPSGGTTVESTSWWVDFSNFFEGVGALGGGNVTLVAGGNVSNVDALVPTNQQTTSQTTAAGPAGAVTDTQAIDQPALELGGGDLLVRAGGNINGGVYYVERGQGSLYAGGSIETNSTRAALSQRQVQSDPLLVADPISWLPTTLFLGQGDFAVFATHDVLLGPVANPFLLPQGSANGIDQKTYFSTFATSDAVSVSSLAGTVDLKDAPDGGGQGVGGTGSLVDWLNLVTAPINAGSFAQASQPWLATLETNVTAFTAQAGLMPATLQATAFSGDVDITGTLTLSPAAGGQVAIFADGSINGVQPNAANRTTLSPEWGSSVINLSDADPTRIPGPSAPLSLSFPDTGAPSQTAAWRTTSTVTLQAFDSLFAESGSVTGAHAVIQTQQALHAPGPLHAGDTQPVQLYATTGDVSGLTLFAGKSARVIAGRDITDIALYIQNNQPGEVSAVVAGRDLVAYDPTSALRTEAQTGNNQLISTSPSSLPASGTPTAGDIQIGGPGTLEVLAGRNIDLGVGQTAPDGTSVGITSIGNSRDPYLPFGGAGIVMTAGIGGLGGIADAAGGLGDSSIDFPSFIAQYADPATAGANAARYLPELAAVLGVPVAPNSTTEQIWATLLGSDSLLSDPGQVEQEDRLALDVFYLVLRDAGRDHNNPTSPEFGTYAAGYASIQTLFPGSLIAASGANSPWSGSITLNTRLIETTNGGDISIVAPGGGVTVGLPTDPQKPDQGILTERGGNISIYAEDNVEVGTSRIFTLFGGNEVIWSTLGSIAAGSGSRTVHAAPPTRVLIDPQSGDVQNDLAGLATGSGIGVLATLIGVAPGSVDLIAPAGTIDAGDAGIRASGSINIAALHVLNASNIQAGGTTTGVPVAAAPNVGGLTSASSATAASSSTASTVAASQQSATQTQEAVIPSLIDVEVLGYGGGEDFPG